MGDIESKIKLKYMNAKIKQPNIVHTLPDSMRPLINLLRYADSLKSVHLRKIIYLIINSYIKLEYIILSQINPDASSTTRKIMKRMMPKGARMKLLQFMRVLLGINVARSRK